MVKWGLTGFSWNNQVSDSNTNLEEFVKKYPNVNDYINNEYIPKQKEYDDIVKKEKEEFNKKKKNNLFIMIDIISKILVNSKYRLDLKKDDTAVFVVDIPKASKKIDFLLNKDIHKIYKIWLEKTNRTGSVLVGSSVREFLEFFKNYKNE